MSPAIPDKAYIHEDFGDVVLLKHTAYPDLSITMTRGKRTDAQLLAEVDRMFAAGQLGPLPDGYSLTKMEKPSTPAADEDLFPYDNWVGC